MEYKSLAKALSLVVLAGSMMGNEGCEKKDQARGLRRRVQMGRVEAAPGLLPGGGTFDFKFVANSQLYYVLRTTNSFSGAGIGSTDNFDPSAGLTEKEKQMFYNCSAETQSFSARSWVKDAACMIKVPQARIDAEIESFELEDSVKGWVGLPKWANLEFSAMIKRSRLTMDFHAVDPLVPSLHYADSRPNAKQHEFDVQGKVNLGEISLGLGYYYRTPLANVVNKAMMAGITDLKNTFDQGEPWWATVRKNCDNSLIINAGNVADAGLTVGDELVIYNVRYEFDGKACDSKLSTAPIRERDPVAIVKVVNLGPTLAETEFIQNSGERILPGARAYVHKLFVPEKPKK